MKRLIFGMLCLLMACTASAQRMNQKKQRTPITDLVRDVENRKWHNDSDDCTWYFVSGKRRTWVEDCNGNRYAAARQPHGEKWQHVVYVIPDKKK